MYPVQRVRDPDRSTIPCLSNTRTAVPTPARATVGAIRLVRPPPVSGQRPWSGGGIQRLHAETDAVSESAVVREL